MQTLLTQLSDQGLVWKGNQSRSADSGKSLHSHSLNSTGFVSLDELLLCGGWPEKGLIEILVPDYGAGELSLFLPWLEAQSVTSKRKIAFISPPFLPNPMRLLQHGIDPARLWLLKPKREKDIWWTQQQCLKEGHCDAVFMWHNGQSQDTHLRKLHYAAQTGDCLGISIRPLSVQQDSTPAPYRLQLRPLEQEQLEITALKRRGGWSGESATIQLGKTISLPPLPRSSLRVLDIN